ncbi:metallophosphoesterase [Bacillus sp. FJAT-45350]|uniref:metallophosphoesterase n=1 Tax=Bacillus sp. FJAT-45350 TaxID=2011014 RepID=UPI000BB8124B|nr:metallophosphoesterase [Bacillus sp. FJAT-45350]
MIFIVVGILICVFITIYMFVEAHRNRVNMFELFPDAFPKSFDGMKVFFISDIHFRRINEKILEKIRGKADIIVIGGDLLEKKVPFDRVKKNIEVLRSIAPTYFVWGNNDYEGDFRSLDALLLEKNVTILDNKAISLEMENEKIYLLGVDDVGHKRDRLDYALSDCDHSSFRLLVSHNPEIIDKITEDDGIGLLLSGHTHGGQIRFWGFGLGEVGSLKKHGNFLHLNSNGYGTTRVPFRLGAPSETHLLTLRAKKDK